MQTQAENSADKPASGVARVERQCPIDQPNHGADILADLNQHKGGVGEDARVGVRHLKRLPSKITGLAAGTVKSRIFRARAQLKEIVEKQLGEKIR